MIFLDIYTNLKMTKLKISEFKIIFEFFDQNF